MPTFVPTFAATAFAASTGEPAHAARQLYVNQQHPERNADVILFLDNFAEAQQQNGGTLDLAVRAAATLAEHYLAVQDRVGIVGFGGIVRWLTPASGTLQSYRIAEALLETEINFSYVWRRIDVLPARSLTPQALVIALSPLLDERGMFALVDLRRRGFDLAVVDVSPIPFAGSKTDPRRRSDASPLAPLARDASRALPGARYRGRRSGRAPNPWRPSSRR